MQPQFGIERERHNKLFWKRYKNDKGILHFHSQIELYFVEEGEMEIFVNNHRRILKAGEMSVALSYDAHAYRTPKSSRSSTLIIPSYLCEEFLTAIKDKEVSNPFICNTETVNKIKACVSELQRESINSIEQLGYIYLILGLVMENICFARAEKKPVDTQLSTQILFYINENYKTNITLDVLSSAFGYSQGYLSRYFKSCFHIGLSQYITIVRLKHALALMHDQKYTLAYCALESGFNSMRTFYRSFYNEFACSPKEYLKQLNC